MHENVRKILKNLLPKLSYRQLRKGEVYTSSPSDTVDVARFSNGHPDFCVATGSQEQVAQKTIILTDWSLRNLPYDWQVLIRYLIENLLQAGFPIYVYSKKDDEKAKLVPITSLESFAETSKYVAPASEAEVYAATTQLGKTRDEIAIADYFEIRNWLKDILYQPVICQTKIYMLEHQLYNTLDIDDLTNLIKSDPEFVEAILATCRNKLINLKFNFCSDPESLKLMFRTAQVDQLIYTDYPDILGQYMHGSLNKLPAELMQLVLILNMFAYGALCVPEKLTWLRTYLQKVLGLELQTLAPCDLFAENHAVVKVKSENDLKAIRLDADIKIIDLTDHPDSNTLLRVLNLPKLELLYFFADDSYIDIPAALPESTGLRQLYCDFENPIEIEILRRSPFIEELYISVKISRGSICIDPNLQANFIDAINPQLKSLVFNQMPFIQVNFLKNILDKCSELKELTLLECNLEGDLSILATIPPERQQYMRIIIDHYDLGTHLSVYLPHCNIVFPPLTVFPPFTQALGHSDPYADTLKVDTNISSNTTKYKCKKYFPAVDPANYRLGLYDLQLTGTFVIFKRIADSAIQLIREIPVKASRKPFFQGRCTVAADGEWHQLPSLDPNETLVYLAASSNIPYTIGYSPITNFHYIRFSKPMHYGSNPDVQINFGVAFSKPKRNVIAYIQDWISPTDDPQTIIIRRFANNLTVEALQSLNSLRSTPFFKEFKAIPEEAFIRAVVKYFKKFTYKRKITETFGRDNDPIKRKLLAIIQQGTGVCRHRAEGAAFLLSLRGINVRVVRNECHGYVEIYSSQQKKWQGYDLGGGPGEIFDDDNDLLVPQATTTDSQTQREPSSTAVLQSLLSATSEEQPATASVFETQSIALPAALGQCVATVFQYTTDPRQNMLIKCSPDQADLLGLELLKHVQSDDYDCIYIDSPDDIAAAMHSIDPKTGETKKDGPLAKFINPKAQHAKPRVLIINWKNFDQVGKLTAYQSIYDPKSPKLDGMPFAKDITVIGLLPENADPGDDFWSRCGVVAKTSAELTEQPQAAALAPEYPPDRTVNLYEDSRFLPRLLGKQSIVNGQVHPIEEMLAIAANEKWPVMTVINPPRKFDLFRRRIEITGQVTFAGRVYNFVPGFKINVIRDDYCLTRDHVTNAYYDGQKFDYLLNDTSFENFFTVQQIWTDNIRHLDGWIKQVTGRTVTILVTTALQPNQWARLFDEAAKFNCQLELKFAPSIEIPAELIPADPQPPVAILASQSRCQIITTQNPAAVAKKYETDLEIPISEDTDDSDLIQTITTTPRSGAIPLIDTQLCTVGKYLQQGKTVVLRGHISPRLLQKLELLFRTNPPRLFINGEYTSCTGKLIVVTDSSVPDHFPHEQIDACVRPIPAMPKPNYQATAEMSADVYTEYRNGLVTTALTQSPHVFIEGSTSVGKSAFVNLELTRLHPNWSILSGLANLAEWAKKPTAKEACKVLFVDEANLLEAKQIAIFEGLYCTPPGILINGIWHELTPQHKVIFAGNPANYEGRRCHEFFERHSVRVAFDALPRSYLREKIIGSIPIADSVREQLINVYQAFPGKPALTPRDLRIMALNAAEGGSVFDMIAHRLTAEELISLAEQAGISEPQTLQQCLAQSHQDLMSRWNAHQVTKTKPIILTKSLVSAVALLDKFGRLRSSGQMTGGVLLEGSSGVGKSAVVREGLKWQGYCDGAKPQHAGAALKFYQLNAGGDPQELKVTLERAYREGALVIIEEINLLPTELLEEYLNPMMEGRYDPIPHPNPGFCVIATQNPPESFKGRQKCSSALASRFTKVVIQDYDEQDLTEILIGKKLPAYQATQLTRDYLSTRARCLRLHKSPVPTPRDLFKQAQTELSRQQEQMHYCLATAMSSCERAYWNSAPQTASREMPCLSPTQPHQVMVADGS